MSLAGQATPETVLVVDAEVLVRTALAAYLRECGYRVLEAASAAEAMQLLDNDDAVSVVLSAVRIDKSETDGFALARWVRRERPGCDVMLAGSVSRAAEAAGELCEEGPTLTRPYEPQLVADRIRRLLAQRRRGD